MRMVIGAGKKTYLEAGRSDCLSYYYPSTIRYYDIGIISQCSCLVAQMTTEIHFGSQIENVQRSDVSPPAHMFS